ncbi:MAG TPA: hypothetical protein VHP33_24800 [Polyangiaceae bacterium]|nr:hypothetical protein [Polyangiaceae bacterium]
MTTQGFARIANTHLGGGKSSLIQFPGISHRYYRAKRADLASVHAEEPVQRACINPSEMPGAAPGGPSGRLRGD